MDNEFVQRLRNQVESDKTSSYAPATEKDPPEAMRCDPGDELAYLPLALPSIEAGHKVVHCQRQRCGIMATFGDPRHHRAGNDIFPARNCWLCSIGALGVAISAVVAISGTAVRKPREIDGLCPRAHAIMPTLPEARRTNGLAALGYGAGYVRRACAPRRPEGRARRVWEYPSHL